MPLTGTIPLVNPVVCTLTATWDCGGGGGFCTFAVLPPHPASTEIITAGRRRRIHRLVVTADLLELLRHLALTTRSDLNSNTNSHIRPSGPESRRSLSRATQIDKLGNAVRFRRVIDSDFSGVKSDGAGLESYSQSATTAGSEGSRAIIRLRVAAAHQDLADEGYRLWVRQVRVVEKRNRQ